MATELTPLPTVADLGGNANQNWLDVQGLTALKAQAGANAPEALKKVAQQFESLFLGMMLKSMRDAKLGEGAFDSDSTKFYQDLYDEQLSVSLSQGKGLGIASMLVKSLSPHTPSTAATDPRLMTAATSASAAQALHLPLRRSSAPIIGAISAAEAPAASAPQAPVSGSPAASRSSVGPNALAKTPEEFVAMVMPHAVSAGASLGVSPLVLVAQAALETRWGQQVPTAPEGSSFNLFGIKADSAWLGKRVSKETVEYSGGMAVRRHEPFRAYESLENGFHDFVSFLKGNLRYASALGVGSDVARFTSALQGAGYATDPAYAMKINAILSSDTLRRAVGALKNVVHSPIQ